jgi:hypothetical protein
MGIFPFSFKIILNVNKKIVKICVVLVLAFCVIINVSSILTIFVEYVGNYWNKEKHFYNLLMVVIYTINVYIVKLAMVISQLVLTFSLKNCSFMSIVVLKLVLDHVSFAKKISTLNLNILDVVKDWFISIVQKILNVLHVNKKSLWLTWLIWIITITIKHASNVIFVDKLLCKKMWKPIKMDFYIRSAYQK